MLNENFFKMNYSLIRSSMAGPNDADFERLLILILQVIPLVLTIIGTISSIRTAITLSYLLKCKWTNSDFLFLTVTIYNLCFSTGSIYNSLYVLKNSRPGNYFEIVILGILNGSYISLYGITLLTTTIEMWLAVRMPLWHRINVTKQKVIMCSLIITIACVIPNMLPELIAPGTAFIYIEEIYFASISDKGNMGYGIVWFIILNVGCILTFLWPFQFFALSREGAII